VSKEGAWPLYIPLYGGQGSVWSWMAFANTGTNDVSGIVSWIKPNLPRVTYYPASFTNSSYASGSRYTPPPRGSQQFPFTNAAIVLEGAGLGQPVTNHVVLSANNTITSTNKTVMTFSLGAGTFSGKVPNESAKPFVFGGVILTILNEGQGYFMTTNLSGSLRFIGE